MRKDMAKVLTERPRVGSPRWDSNPRRLPRPRSGFSDEVHELAPTKEGMRAPYKERKCFSDLIGPLRKFLRRRVGRRWDDVYSEISAVLKGRNTVLLHVIQHVRQFVHQDVLFDERHQAYTPSSWGGGLRPLPSGELFIDGLGYLRIVPDQRRRRFSRETDADLLLSAIHDVIRDARLEIEGGVLWRLHRDSLTNEWTVRNVATERHARQDFEALIRFGKLETFSPLLAKVSVKSKYLDTLKDLIRGERA